MHDNLPFTELPSYEDWLAEYGHLLEWLTDTQPETE